MKIILVLLPLYFFAVSPSAQSNDLLTDEQIATAIEASNKKRGSTTFWRSDELGVIFGYDERWKPANASQKSTAAVVNWTSRRSGGLMATCYLETKTSVLGQFTPEMVKQRAKLIADAVLKNGRLRDPSMQLTDWRVATQDNHPVVYIERDMSVTNLNGTTNSRIYSMFTSWQGREVNMECASTIPVSMPKLSGIVEGPIKKVLSSLQFIRVR